MDPDDLERLDPEGDSPEALPDLPNRNMTAEIVSASSGMPSKHILIVAAGVLAGFLVLSLAVGVHMTLR